MVLPHPVLPTTATVFIYLRGDAAARQFLSPSRSEQPSFGALDEAPDIVTMLNHDESYHGDNISDVREGGSSKSEQDKHRRARHEARND